MARMTNIRDLAAYLKFSEDTIRRLIKNHEIPFIKIRGAYRFDLDQIEAWIEAQTTHPDLVLKIRRRSHEYLFKT